MGLADAALDGFGDLAVGADDERDVREVPRLFGVATPLAVGGLVLADGRAELDEPRHVALRQRAGEDAVADRELSHGCSSRLEHASAAAEVGHAGGGLVRACWN